MGICFSHPSFSTVVAFLVAKTGNAYEVMNLPCADTLLFALLFTGDCADTLYLLYCSLNIVLICCHPRDTFR